MELYLIEKPRDSNFLSAITIDDNIAQDEKINVKELNFDLDIFKENSSGKSFESLEEIEFAFIKLTRLKNIYVFTNLRELTIISCPILSISGLEYINNSLEVLYIILCDLTTIEKTFTKLTNLKVLSLGENKIKEIRNLHK